MLNSFAMTENFRLGDPTGNFPKLGLRKRLSQDYKTKLRRSTQKQFTGVCSSFNYL